MSPFWSDITQGAKVFTRSNMPSMSKRKSQKISSGLQDLVDTLKGLTDRDFEANIDTVSKKLEGVTLEDVGLESYAEAARQACRTTGGATMRSKSFSELLRPPRLPRQMVYIHIFENKQFSIGIFCFPAKTTLPLHNHPDMTVLSRVLYGAIQVKGYDWVGSSSAAEEGLPQPARLTFDQCLREDSQPAVLRPRSGGNVHKFYAEQHSAILDVLWPPYDNSKGRDCTYYKIDETATDGTVRLMVDSMPDVPPMANGSFGGIPLQNS